MLTLMRNRGPTISELLPDYFLWKERRLDRNLAEQTMILYSDVLHDFQRHLEAQGIMTIKAVSEAATREYLDFKTAKGCAPYTMRNYRSHLKNFFSFCVDTRIIRRSPAATVKVGKIKQRNKPAYPLSDLRERFLTGCVNAKNRLLVLTCSYTGARIGEIIKLNWTDSIDRQKGVLIVNGKTGRREVPISTAFQAVLEEHRNGHPFFFPPDQCHAAKYEHLRRTRLIMMFKEIARRCGMPEVTSHSFRRSVATHLMRQGVDAKTVAAILGMTVKVLLDHYIDTDLVYQREVVELL